MSKPLRDAGHAARNLGSAIGGPQKSHAETIGKAFDDLSDHLAAIEEILKALAKKNGVSADDVAQARLERRTAEAEARLGREVQLDSDPRSAAERRIRRILG